jgi:hypothetical protein
LDPAPVPALTTVTEAPGTADPELSETWTSIAPVVPCAKAAPAIASRQKIGPTANARNLPFENFSHCILNLLKQS